MRAIQKRSEPSSLTTHRAKSHSGYGNLPDRTKQHLRKGLVGEQRELCCYCMGRIAPTAERMKIEHWACQNGTKRDLTYGNLLGACYGGEGQPDTLQHCDTRKGNATLTFNPANPAHSIESRIRFEPDGTIWSNHTRFDEELRTVLNLNIPSLKANRQAMLDGVLDWWNRERKRLKGSVPRASLQQKRDFYLTGTTFRPYSPVAVWFLNLKLSKMK